MTQYKMKHQQTNQYMKRLDNKETIFRTRMTYSDADTIFRKANHRTINSGQQPMTELKPEASYT